MILRSARGDTPLSTVNYRRTFSVSDDNALTFNSFVMEKNVNRQRVTFFSPTKKLNIYFFKIVISVNFQRFNKEGYS